MFGDIAGRLEDTGAAVGRLTDYALDVVAESFRTEKSPDGEAWPQLSRRYASRKASRVGGRRMLSLSGALERDVLTRYEVSSRSVKIGPQAGDVKAVHQRGHESTGNAARIPARAFLGSTQAQAGEMGLIVLNHIRGVI